MVNPKRTCYGDAETSEHHVGMVTSHFFLARSRCRTKLGFGEGKHGGGGGGKLENVVYLTGKC